jgi:hypothetical protein
MDFVKWFDGKFVVKSRLKRSIMLTCLLSHVLVRINSFLSHNTNVQTQIPRNNHRLIFKSGTGFVIGARPLKTYFCNVFYPMAS